VEPGVFGIRHPVLLLPEGIADRLTPAQLEAVLAHEMCHVRRCDNLTAAIHLIVEALFWFHPLVWWIRGRLVEERERACDEDVLQLGGEPQVYAEAIRNVCNYYLKSPVVCVSGITGPDLKKRIDTIMAHHLAQNLNRTSKLLLATAGITAVVMPIAIGLVNAPASRAQATRVRPQFEVASVKPSSRDARSWSIEGGPGGPDPERIMYTNVPLETLLTGIYNVPANRISGPSWLRTERFDIVAKIPSGATREDLRLMLQNLLAERFKLALHRERKEISGYSLRINNNGLKMKESRNESGPAASANEGTRLNEAGAPPRSPKPDALDQNGFPIIDIAQVIHYFRPVMGSWRSRSLTASHARLQ
jgi:uncharacterized protein (TIGR03435 family)